MVADNLRGGGLKEAKSRDARLKVKEGQIRQKSAYEPLNFNASLSKLLLYISAILYSEVEKMVLGMSR